MLPVGLRDFCLLYATRISQWFPIEYLQDLVNEVKFSRYAETQGFVTEVNISEFIRLYINHRYVFESA